MREVVQSKIEYYTCDYCNGELEYITIEVNFGYGSHRDGKQTHFCSDECLSKYLLKTKKSCVNDAKGRLKMKQLDETKMENSQREIIVVFGKSSERLRELIIKLVEDKMIKDPALEIVLETLKEDNKELGKLEDALSLEDGSK